MFTIFEEHGIRFRYPSNWDFDIDDDGPMRTLSLQSPGGLAFAVIVLDQSRREPEDLVEETLAAMQGEYDQIEVRSVVGAVDGHQAIGHDLEFLSLDMPNSASIRCYRTAMRTILFFGQWSELDPDDPAEIIQGMLASLEETDGYEGAWFFRNQFDRVN